MREALASIVASRRSLEGAHILELYAGTGAFSFELLSRGAGSACLVEQDGRACREIEASADALGLRTELHLVRASAESDALVERLGELAPLPFELVFADPPYAQAEAALRALARLARSDVLADDALVLLEHATRDASALDDALGVMKGGENRPPLRRLARYRYGESSVSLYELDRHRADPNREDSDPEGEQPR